MHKSFYFLLAAVLLLTINASAQKVTYTEPDRDDTRQLNFEIIGKLGANILIYKNVRDNHFIVRYDQNMKLIDKTKLGFMPDRVINADFFNYPRHAYMIYQYQRKNVVYCMGVKIDAEGKAVGEPLEMDTTQISFWASNRLYTVISSEDKKKIAVFKMNTKNEKQYILTTAIFDDTLKLLQKHRMYISMPERNDYLTEFTLDNDGDLAFLKVGSINQNDNIDELQLYIKPLQSESIAHYDVSLKKNMYLDDVRMKADNVNKRFLITSFYSKSRRNNIEGLYSFIWDKQTASAVVADGIQFSDDLRSDVRTSNSSIKSVFNDFFIRNMVMRSDGGYLITAEAIYTTTRGGSPFNRWNYYSPYASPYGYQAYGRYSYMYPWSGNSAFANTTRYFADNVLVLSFDNTGKLEWSNLVRKSQYDDNTDDYLGYSMLNTGNALHFLFNLQEKRNLILTDQEIDPSGQVKRNPTFRNLDKGFDFMPRYGKQIGSKTIIVPCQYRNYICFAKVELS